ncbi:MAG: O-antigen ligase family protein [Verrucomicrobiales bacterium]
MIWLTLSIFAWGCISALNARAIFTIPPPTFEYLDPIRFLPHSYDKEQTWYVLESYFSLALIFWAAYIWLRGSPRNKRSNDSERLKAKIPNLNPRVARMAWVICINGACLALAGIFQKLHGTWELLWILPTEIGRPETHFGPFNYRGNGAQFCNMIWPVAFGLFWELFQSSRASSAMRPHAQSSPYPLLALLTIAAYAGTMTAASRGGVLIAIIATPIMLFWLWSQRSRGEGNHKGVLAVIALAAVGISLYAAWEPLSQRTGSLVDGSNTERVRQYLATWEAINDKPVFGYGPGSYLAIYTLYHFPGEPDYEMAHSDYLQTVVEWGLAGGGLIFLCLAISIIYGAKLKGGSPGIKAGIAIALGTVLLHALFDFPFFIWSLRCLFAVLLAMFLANSEWKKRVARNHTKASNFETSMNNAMSTS